MASDLWMPESVPDVLVASGRTRSPDFTTAELGAGARRPSPLWIHRLSNNGRHLARNFWFDNNGVVH